MTPEVTQDMILDKYNVKLKNEKITGWVKEIILTDAEGKEFDIKLCWNIDDGYWLSYAINMSDDTINVSRLPEMDMPEFEYILDSIIEDMKYDKDNPWNYVDFASQP